MGKVKQNKSIPFQNKICCNPFNDHRPKFVSLRNVTEDLVKQAKAIRLELIPNKKICESCYKKVKNRLKNPQNVWQESDNEEIDITETFDIDVTSGTSTEPVAGTSNKNVGRSTRGKKYNAPVTSS